MYRSKKYSRWSNIKCFHRTDLVSAIHNHQPIKCVANTQCHGVDISTSKSILLHYRRNQSAVGYTDRNTDCPIHDDTIWRFFEPLQTNVKSKLSKIFNDNRLDFVD